MSPVQQEFENQVSTCLELTETILAEIATETPDFEKTAVLFEKRETVIKDLGLRADNKDVKEFVSTSTNWNRLMMKDEMMRFLLEKTLDTYSTLLFNSRNEEHTGNVYTASAQREVFITGKLEG